MEVVLVDELELAFERVGEGPPLVLVHGAAEDSRHPELVATMILADTYAGWKGSLSAEEVEARVESYL